MKKTLKELHEFLAEGEIHGNPATEISGVCTVENPRSGCLTFATSEKWLKKLASGSVGAVIIKPGQETGDMPALVHSHPYLAFVRLVELFHPSQVEHEGVAGNVDIAADASIGAPVTIKPGAVIGARSVIGNGSYIGAGVKIGNDVTIGEDCHLHANVVIENGCTLGNHVIIHAGTIIGADGFGYLQHQGRNVKIPQIGTVVIGNDVEIGANCCIDRGTIDDTVIGNGVVLDNLVQIGHNVLVEDHAVIVAQVGLAGSSSVGRGAILGGKAGATERVRIGEGAMLAAQAIATREIKPRTINAGHPAVDIDTWRKAAVISRKLPSVWTKIQKLLRESE